MPRPSHHLPAWYSLLMIAFEVLLMFCFAGMWPEWLTRPLAWATGTLMLSVMSFAIFLGIIIAFILIVRPRR